MKRGIPTLGQVRREKKKRQARDVLRREQDLKRKEAKTRSTAYTGRKD